MSCAKTAEPIEMPFGWLLRVDPWNVPAKRTRRKNAFAAARGDQKAMRCNDKVLKLFGRRVGLCVEWSDVNGVQVCCK